MIVLGVDPGKTGGLALVEVDGVGRIDVRHAMRTPTMQVRAKVALDGMEAFVRFGGRAGLPKAVGVVELVHAMPRQGVSSSFQFGRMFGGVEVLVHCLCDRVEYVAPNVWKKAMGLSSSKRASLDLATRMLGQEAADKWWPLMKDEGVAEAALIAVWYVRHALRT